MARLCFSLPICNTAVDPRSLYHYKNGTRLRCEAMAVPTWFRGKITFRFQAATETVRRGGQSLPLQSPAVRPVAEPMGVAAAQTRGGLAGYGGALFPQALRCRVVAQG